MSDFENAKRDWDREVDAEAARLVRAGIPPLDAIERAREIVSRRRRAAQSGSVDVKSLIKRNKP